MVCCIEGRLASPVFPDVKIQCIFRIRINKIKKRMFTIKKRKQKVCSYVYEGKVRKRHEEEDGKDVLG